MGLSASSGLDGKVRIARDPRPGRRPGALPIPLDAEALHFLEWRESIFLSKMGLGFPGGGCPVQRVAFADAVLRTPGRGAGAGSVNAGHGVLHVVGDGIWMKSCGLRRRLGRRNPIGCG